MNNLIQNQVAIFRSDKILSHIERVADWLNGKNPPPITMEIDLTNRCNNNCPQCIGFRQPLEDLKNPKRIIKEIARFGIKGLIFTGGGEPTLHPEFVDCVQYARILGLDVGVISNGLTLTKEISRAIKPYCVWIRVSLDADSQEMHEKTHGIKDAFEIVCKNIKSLANIEGNATIGVGYLTGKETIKGMLKATKLCKRMKVDYIQFRPYHNDFTLIDKELTKCLKLETEDFKVLYSKHKYDCMKTNDLGRNYSRCYGQQFASVIAATGKMYLCCHFRSLEKYCLGDLNKQSIAEIWNSRKRLKAIKNIGNFEDCVSLCRCNSMNQILFDIKRKKEHINFL